VAAKRVISKEVVEFFQHMGYGRVIFRGRGIWDVVSGIFQHLTMQRGRNVTVIRLEYLGGEMQFLCGEIS